MAGPVVVCSWGCGRDGLPPGAEAALSTGGELARATGSQLRWFCLGPLAERAVEAAAGYGVSAIDHAAGAELETFSPDVFVAAIAKYAEPLSPLALLFSQTFEARVAAPRVAGRLDHGVVMNALAVEAGHPVLRVTASAYGGDTRAVYEVRAGACVIGLLTDAIDPVPAPQPSKPSVENVNPDVAGVAERIRVVEPARAEGPRLEDAQIIVAGGRGLGAKENFRLVEELAEALGGMAGASRPIVDDGWVDSSRQVGLTGKITRPVLYIAAGISGASQHMVGCAAAKTLVAINTDPDANIFRYARYGVVADCLEVLPEITRAVRESRKEA